MDEVITWFISHIDVIGAAVFGSFIYFLNSDEHPTKKKIASTLSGLFMAIVFAPPICEHFGVIKLDFLLAGVFGLSGRWAVDIVMAIVRKLTKTKFGV